MIQRSLTPVTFIRIGLALVFLASSLTAFTNPTEFTELIEKSFLSNILPFSPSVFVAIIGINDLLISLLLALNVGRKWLSVWAALWIMGAMSVIGTPLGILEESGFLFMALALTRAKD